MYTKINKRLFKKICLTCNTNNEQYCKIILIGKLFPTLYISTYSLNIETCQRTITISYCLLVLYTMVVIDLSANSVTPTEANTSVLYIVGSPRMLHAVLIKLIDHQYVKYSAATYICILEH